MKKQVLNQLESLIKKFNDYNTSLGYKEYEYVMEKPIQHKRGHYSVNIRYNMFFSIDMRDLMEFIRENGLILRLGYYTSSAQPYMDIQ